MSLTAGFSGFLPYCECSSAELRMTVMYLSGRGLDAQVLFVGNRAQITTNRLNGSAWLKWSGY